MLALVIDHYDSFVYNIVQLLREEGVETVTLRPNDFTINAIERMRPDGIILSPGPGNPYTQKDRFGKSIEIVRRYGRKIPVMGVCLGMQIINVAFNGTLRRAKNIFHGVVDEIMLKESKIYLGLPKVIKGTRYHSLVVDKIGNGLKVNALSMRDGEVMGVEHEEYPIFGFQFHPESIGSLPMSKMIFRNFVYLMKVHSGLA